MFSRRGCAGALSQNRSRLSIACLHLEDTERRSPSAEHGNSPRVAAVARRPLRTWTYPTGIASWKSRQTQNQALSSPDRPPAMLGKVGPGPVELRPSARAMIVAIEPITWANLRCEGQYVVRDMWQGHRIPRLAYIKAHVICAESRVSIAKSQNGWRKTAYLGPSFATGACQCPPIKLLVSCSRMKKKNSKF